MNARTLLRSLASYTIISVLGAFCFIPLFIIACLPERWRYDNAIYYKIIDFFFKCVVLAARVPVQVRGVTMPHEPAIIIANHQSSFDIPLLGVLMNGYPHVWLFLARFAKIPLFGFVTRRMNIVVDYVSTRRLVGALDEALDIIHSYRSHVILFPEGGRYTDGTIHKFLWGFAILAKKTGRPVVPVLIQNAHKVYPPGSFLVHSHPITLTVGQPFMCQKDESEEAFIQRVHAWFSEKNME